MAKNKLRVAKYLDYWWDVIVGGLLTLLILIPSGWIYLQKLKLEMWFYPYSIFCISIVSFYQWRDDNFTIVNTGLSKTNNFNLATTSLDKLNWHYVERSKSVDLELNKYLLLFLKPTIIPEGGRVLINFKYHSTARTGRLPFFFGISTFLEWKFKRKLKKTLPDID